MADLKETVATNVRRFRNARRWTQEDLADRVDLSARYVGQIERAQASMSVTVLGRLADVFELDAGELVKRAGKFPVDEMLHHASSSSRQTFQPS
jgi:transcriptional regulator with XRE-family HTH domain